MIDTTSIDDWLARYRHAWSTDDPEEIAALFTADILYFTAPYHEPLRGLEEVAAYWLCEKESDMAWSFDPQVLAREGDLWVVRAVTTYPQGTRDAGGVVETFHNIWLITLDEDGRASEFVEYYMPAG
jgi:ketosteroid isomerase-like protein